MIKTYNFILTFAKIYELDKEQIAKEELYDGFYAVMTNLEGNIEEIIKINKQR